MVVLVDWMTPDHQKIAKNQSTANQSNAIRSSNAEAQALFQQALTVLMPPEDETRLYSSLNLFQRVIEVDPDFAGGFAGRSIALSFKVLFIKSIDTRSDLREAVSLAESAVERNSAFNLGYAALSLSNALSSEHELALDAARRVVAIRPRSADANAIAALALIVSGKPSKAVEMLTEAIKLNPDDERTPYLNLLGAANYVNGDYLKSAEYFERNIDQGGPTGPHIDVFLAASYVQADKVFEARALVEKLRETNPDFPFESWLKNYIVSEKALYETMNKLIALGLPH